MPKPTGREPKPRRFENVEFRSMYPPEEVPDHIALMSFTGGSDCYAFHDWWGEEGAILFQAWLDKRKD